jgi:hypothetical protein
MNSSAVGWKQKAITSKPPKDFYENLQQDLEISLPVDLRLVRGFLGVRTATFLAASLALFRLVPH